MSDFKSTNLWYFLLGYVILYLCGVWVNFDPLWIFLTADSRFTFLLAGLIFSITSLLARLAYKDFTG